ncbi:MAG: GNAT family N-acetyltransferase [Bacilli bacterium]|nr:GNAT family N-acetyltransferase [Bacilli bacterium]
MNFENITLRRLKDNNEDYKLLEKWYQQKEIYTHFEQRKLNLEEIKSKYYPRTLDNSSISVYMIEYKNIPVGIIQYQSINNDNKVLYKIDSDNCYEIDVFIGELDYHNMGIGYKSINMISDYLFNEKNANLLVISPLKSNINAIKCYKKSGFEIKDNYITENTIGILQEYVLMTKEK